MTTRPRIKVTIDHMALRGCDPAEAAGLRRALGQELRNLLATVDAGSVARGGDRARLRVELGPESRGRALSASVASAIVDALGAQANRRRS